MNAGGVLNTCKSNGPRISEASAEEIHRDSGGRVSNTGVTYLRDGGNIPKGVLIPDILILR